ncbi:MAG: hypothetical protein BWX80_01843 [Candidatus Hydrogenedentes bacterium ADurb.Bin101]|nr:MAG: hypothetical protein BWX80_01843 [Candidatus Hydrogenedentes bacterium ADurb.Bin101]
MAFNQGGAVFRQGRRRQRDGILPGRVTFKGGDNAHRSRALPARQRHGIAHAGPVEIALNLLHNPRHLRTVLKVWGRKEVRRHRAQPGRCGGFNQKNVLIGKGAYYGPIALARHRFNFRHGLLQREMAWHGHRRRRTQREGYLRTITRKSDFFEYSGSKGTVLSPRVKDDGCEGFILRKIKGNVLDCPGRVKPPAAKTRAIVFVH